MPFFENNILKIDNSHMKAANFQGLSWLKKCTGHMYTSKTLPSFAHPDGTDICPGPLTMTGILHFYQVIQYFVKL